MVVSVRPPSWPREEPLKTGFRFLTAVLMLAGALPLAEAATKHNCGNRCQLDYNTCLKSAQSKSARKSCKASHKTCKRVCY
jgi:hypothetical protein